LGPRFSIAGHGFGHKQRNRHSSCLGDSSDFADRVGRSPANYFRRTGKLPAREPPPTRGAPSRPCWIGEHLPRRVTCAAAVRLGRARRSRPVLRL